MKCAATVLNAIENGENTIAFRAILITLRPQRDQIMTAMRACYRCKAIRSGHNVIKLRVRHDRARSQRDQATKVTWSGCQWFLTEVMA